MFKCSNLVSSLYDFWSLVKIKDWNQRSPKIPTRYDFVKKRDVWIFLRHCVGMSEHVWITIWTLSWLFMLR